MVSGIALRSLAPGSGVIMSQSISLRAYAKLNLYLEVLGRRADGFHRLETVFQTIDLHDRLTVRRDADRQGIGLTCDLPGIPSDSSNLVWRAIAAYIAGREAEAGHFHCHLEKGIPHGAGLGGGSSDAAAILRALSQLLPGWHTQVELMRIAAALGSDVPFFLVGGTAMGEERGEVLTPLADVMPTAITLVMPHESLPTPRVFSALTDEERGPRSARGSEWFRSRLDRGDWSTVLFNRLTEPAVRCCPTVGVLLHGLRAQQVPCLMSGSGAACFAIGHARSPIPGRCWHTRFLSRAEALHPAELS
jgi:4-diphosphocytidyl-2-C-methyl-D-erythritol kinase